MLKLYIFVCSFLCVCFASSAASFKVFFLVCVLFIGLSRAFCLIRSVSLVPYYRFVYFSFLFLARPYISRSFFLFILPCSFFRVRIYIFFLYSFLFVTHVLKTPQENHYNFWAKLEFIQQHSFKNDTTLI